VKTTQKLGNACVQTGRLYGPGQNNQYDATIGTSIGKTTGAEDCLYLNIWAPSTAAATDKLPVIVFVYGGSNITGYTGDPVYDGAALAKAANAVVVTVNYRLGIMGFLASPQLKTGADANDDSGNYAILDLIKGMKFVNANIAAFGGDPGNVTLMGQSAGAVNIYALMVSPLVANAKPALFQRLVPLSGGVATATTQPNQVNALLSALLVADGTVADTTAAAAYIAGQSNADLAAYLRVQERGHAAADGAEEAGAAGPLGLQPAERRHGGSGRSDRGDQCREVPEGAGAGRLHARRDQALPAEPGHLARVRRHQPSVRLDLRAFTTCAQRTSSALLNSSSCLRRSCSRPTRPARRPSAGRPASPSPWRCRR
jgi:hypothetical protein